MRIGVLTYFNVSNFGANLQALSTYCYLKKHGHNPIMIHYESDESFAQQNRERETFIQSRTHLSFVNKHFISTERCKDAKEINEIINKYEIEAIIIGSDAVLQHHPLMCRIKAGRRKPFYISHMVQERTFPNPFWGCGVLDLPIIMMSVSSQNSEYRYFSKNLKRKMYESLKRMKYISVRDRWTKDLLCELSPEFDNVPITPDPVFSFNQNVGDLVEDEEIIRNKYNLRNKYVLISLSGQSLSYSLLEDLKNKFENIGFQCVAFPLPKGVMFKHPFSKEIKLPLSPIDWYSIIRYSSGYIGTNMHPIVVCLHNAIPCFSIDSWGTTNFWGKHKDDNSSKVQHILNTFNLGALRYPVDRGECKVSSDKIYKGIVDFPQQCVREYAIKMFKEYDQMMDEILLMLK